VRRLVPRWGLSAGHRILQTHQAAAQRQGARVYRMDDATLLALASVETWAGRPLPYHYRAFLLEHPAGISGDVVVLYGIEQIVERNQTYETKKYCPGHVVVGDDGGGDAIVLALDDEVGRVFLVDHGAMTPDCFHPVASSFRQWLQQGYPLPDD
jgi:hypothetical protein